MNIIDYLIKFGYINKNMFMCRNRINLYNILLWRNLNDVPIQLCYISYKFKTK